MLRQADWQNNVCNETFSCLWWSYWHYTTVLHWPNQLTSGQWLDLIQTWLPAQHKIAQAMLISKIIHNIDMHILQVVGVGENGIQCNVAILTLTYWLVLYLVLLFTQLPTLYVLLLPTTVCISYNAVIAIYLGQRCQNITKVVIFGKDPRLLIHRKVYVAQIGHIGCRYFRILVLYYIISRKHKRWRIV